MVATQSRRCWAFRLASQAEKGFAAIAAFCSSLLALFRPTRIDRRTARTSAGRVVEENALQAHISALRAGLGSERELNSAAFAGSLRERRWLASDPWRLRAVRGLRGSREGSGRPPWRGQGGPVSGDPDRPGPA
jgi:hypothetical protein